MPLIKQCEEKRIEGKRNRQLKDDRIKELEDFVRLVIKTTSNQALKWNGERVLNNG